MSIGNSGDTKRLVPGGLSLKRLYLQKHLYLMIIPALLFIIVFNYVPMYGVIIAFKKFNPLLGIMGSPWAGLEHFEALLSSQFFWRAFWNTIIINVYKLIFAFPAPILFALLLNEIRNSAFKRTIQTITYMPHFISWVIVGGFIVSLLSPNEGVISAVSNLLTGHKSDIYMMIDEKYFRGILVASSIWKEIGWGSIIYMAAIAGIDVMLYEAAFMDGAGRLKQVWHITLPSIMPTIAVLLILNIGSMLGSDFEQVFVLYNPNVYSVGDVLSTFIYREGLQGMKFSFATAVGLFLSVIGVVLLSASNMISKRILDTNLW